MLVLGEKNITAHFVLSPELNVLRPSHLALLDPRPSKNGFTEELHPFCTRRQDEDQLAHRF